ncbi:S8 family peptidase [Aliihoeflea sp. 40Bstr573]|uniref:S8 family peptidase n=1 Tax=Aliihoeflea sp. 40Bstr573 TaxID=2696467 RepID=UPI002095FD04|nr:S8 family peptidase [Aliihoeflea sp. 40Bstr573]MCO6388720.1 S8 family serine peptidase [Aliihoeflea sp. 40Bstr573]
MAEYEHRHIDLSGLGVVRDYKSPGSNARQRTLQRIREEHGRRLVGELNAALQFTDQRREVLDLPDGAPPPDGVYLEVELAPGVGPTTLERKRERTRQGAVTVTANGARRIALFVPDDTRDVFDAVFRDYAFTEVEDGEKIPKKSRVEPVEHVRTARLQTFWRDDPDALPDDPQAEMWWALWCFRDRVERVDDLAQRLGLTVGDDDTRLRFPEVIVLPVHGRRAVIELLLFSTGGIAEIRRATDTPAVFTDELHGMVSDFVENLAERVTWPGRDVPAVCLLDTGINRGHALIEPALDRGDLHTVVADWGVDDHSNIGHGSGMAGLALHGDLTTQLGDASRPVLSHRLESVKILPPDSFEPNDPFSYGAITTSAAALPEIAASERPRVFCMAVTNENRSGAEPTGWSAALDQISSGADAVEEGPDHIRRLFVQALGNIGDSSHADEIADADAFPGEDPAQAWNVLTVGGTTLKSDIAEYAYRDWSGWSRPGDRSPYSRTTTLWRSSQSPIKPEVVFEAGNRAVSRSGIEAVSGLPSLSLLTTSKTAVPEPIVSFWATSAATAQAGRMAARMMAERPDYWPEAVRALMVHSARWTPHMLAEFAGAAGKAERKALTRKYGYGVPNLRRGIASARDDLALVAQRNIQPFRMDGGNVRFGDAHVYRLPWPRDVLESLGNERIRLKVTLSYFVEPNPSFASAIDPARYQSFGLRFDLKRARETERNFMRRVNKDDRDEGDLRPVNEDNDGWFFGPKSVSAGSVHMDIWEGSAVELAARDLLYVFPISGWWRERKALGRAESKSRYALVVGIEAPDVDVDLITPIATELANLIAAGVAIET